MNILVLNTQILAVDPVDAGDNWETSDQIIPKHVAEGAELLQIADAEFSHPLSWYRYIAGTVVLQPPVIPPSVPDSINPRQIRLALSAAGLRTQVEAAVSSGDQDLKDWWEFSGVFERYHSKVLTIAQALGVSDAQLDAIWIAGVLL